MVQEYGKVKTIRHITFVNIRVAHEVLGCGLKVLPYIISKETIHHTLIISPPKCGKTTLLRDLIRMLSNGTDLSQGLTVGLVDERSEIAGAYQGVPQNDIGPRTDLLDSCNKKEGMLMLIRSMSPQVIAIDEIGDGEEINALEYAINCGCKVIATIHGNDLKEVFEKPVLKALVLGGSIDRFVLIKNESGIGDVKEVYDKEKKLIRLIREGGEG